MEIPNPTPGLTGSGTWHGRKSELLYAAPLVGRSSTPFIAAARCAAAYVSGGNCIRIGFVKAGFRSAAFSSSPPFPWSHPESARSASAAATRPLRNQRIHRPALVRPAPLRHAIQHPAAIHHEAGFGIAPIRAAGHRAEAIEELERAVMELKGGAAALSDNGRVAALRRSAKEIARNIADDARPRASAVRAVRHRAEVIERRQVPGRRV